MINIQNEMNKGVFTRSKEKIIEEGETPTKNFFLQEQIKLDLRSRESFWQSR